MVEPFVPRFGDAPAYHDLQWEPDSAAQECYLCAGSFGLFNRRHHCRRCGRLVCADCSANVAPPLPMRNKPMKFEQVEGPTDPVRCCDRCYRLFAAPPRPSTTVVLPGSTAAAAPGEAGSEDEKRRRERRRARRRRREMRRNEQMQGSSSDEGERT